MSTQFVTNNERCCRARLAVF